MVELTDEAKRLLEDEFRKFARENQQVLDEMNVYKWMIRALFVVVLGGSILGVYKLQDYLDDRIATRVEKFDNLYLASVLATSLQNRNALEEIGSFFDKLAEGSKASTNGSVGNVGLGIEQDFSRVSDLSKSQREFFFITLLDTIANIDDIGPDGEYVGKRFWDALTKNRHFIRDFMDGQRWEANERFNNRMANAYARYAENIEQVRLSKRRFQMALDTASISNQRASASFGLTFISLILDDTRSAAEYVNSGNRYRPYYITADALRTGPDFQLYERLWKRFHTADFKQAYEKMFELADRIELEKAVREKLASVKSLDPTFDERRVVASAQSIFVETMSAFYSEDEDVLRKNLDPYLFLSFSGDIANRRKLKRKFLFEPLKTIKSEIVDILDASTISVKFTSERVVWTVNEDGNVVEGDPTRLVRNEDTWTFRRRGGADTPWQVIASK